MLLNVRTGLTRLSAPFTYTQRMTYRCSLVTFSSKETRQKKYVNTLHNLGMVYVGGLSHAKSTLNRFLRHDCKLLGIREIGNGNNLNLTNRLVTRLMVECEQKGLPNHGSYVDLRNRLKPTLFLDAIAYEDPENLTRTEPVTLKTKGTTKKGKKVKKKKEKVALV